MSLNKEDVLHIARLARLELTETELAEYGKQLSAILAYADQLQGVDTSTISPTASVLPLRNVMRDDVVSPGLERDDVLANAPASADGYFVVGAILDGGE